MTTDARPKLLWLRFLRPNLPSFVQLHMQEQELCMGQYFDVTVVRDPECDYQQLCDAHEPDLTILETGVYTGRAEVANIHYSPQVPKLGFVHSDAYCMTRRQALANMAKWDVTAYFGISVSMAEYTPAIADDLFVWPNFVNPELYRDYGNPKVLPVLFTGSQASHYPWRSRIDRLVSRHYPALHSPHWGWSWRKGKPSTAGFLQGEKYAQLLNSAYIAPTCGTIANEVVRKHFEIPATGTCLLTERTAGLEAAGFEDMKNCVFADEHDVLDKLEWLFENPHELAYITSAGKQLVDSRHTIHQRGQVLEWLQAYQQTGPCQKVVQTSPFGPMKMVDAASGEKPGHAAVGGLDRRLLTEGDRHLAAGELAEAQRRYLSCLNYHQPPIPDHTFRMVRCQLHRGQWRSALRTLRELFPSHRSTAAKGFEPDPTEWAWYLIALVCSGKRREAALRAEQFADIHNTDLTRIRRTIATIVGRAPLEPAGRERLSLHQMPPQTDAEWLASLREMLSACGQQKVAEILVDGLTADATTAPRKPQLADSVFEQTLHLQSRLARLEKKVRDRSQRYATKLRKKWAPAPSSLPAGEYAEIVRLVKKEEFDRGVLVGGRCGSWVSQAFVEGMTANPLMPSAVCVGPATSEFAKFHRRHTGPLGCEFRYLAADGRVSAADLEGAGLVVIEQPELLATDARALEQVQLVLVADIDSEAGRACYEALAGGKFCLLAHEPGQGGGYAMLRREVSSQAEESDAVLRIARGA